MANPTIQHAVQYGCDWQQSRAIYTLWHQYNGYMTLGRYHLMANPTIQHAVQSRLLEIYLEYPQPVEEQLYIISTVPRVS
jgi:hypothetical protein